ncbi:MAG: LytTR family DNA-binding domain-containing protein [Tardiphaga sp.]
MATSTVYFVLIAMILLTGLVNALSWAHDAARAGSAYELGRPLLWEMSSVAVIAALTPLIHAGVGWIRRTPGWWLRAALALGVLLLFSALHVGGMVTLRKLAMALAGGTYTFNTGLSELAYEFRKDAVTCFLLGAAFWWTMRDGNGSHARDVSVAAPAAAGPAALWLRDGSARIRIEPHDVLVVSSAGNYVEYSLADGATHLIRSTLAAEASRLSPFAIDRVHRARLVNLKRVRALEWRPGGDFELTLDTGRTVSGSRRYRAAVASIETVG